MRKRCLKFAVKPADFIIFALPLIIAAVCISVMLAKPAEVQNRTAIIILNGETVRTVPLDTAKNQKIDLGLEYKNIIEIKDGAIGIISADCPDKTCVKTGYISRSGQVCVCVPSKLIIKIESGGLYDAKTG